MSTHGQFANPITQTQSPCKLFLQPLFGGRFFLLQLTPGRQANLGLRLYNRPSAVFRMEVRNPMPNATAEERFHTLARGWLAYPVTPMHARLPPKSGCINVIPRFALSRRRATALFRNPVRKAQRSVPGFSSTPTSACRRYATSPPSAVASTSSAIHRIAQYTAIAKTAEERFNMLARGWLAYPVTPGCTHIYRRRAVVEKKTDGWDSNHRSLYRYVLLCDYLLTTRRSLIRAFLPVRLRR